MRHASIPDNDATSAVTEDWIAFYLRETAPTYNNACSLVLVDVVLCQVWTAVEHYNPIVVVVDLIVFNPAEATLDDEDAFATRRIDFIVDHYCFRGTVSAQGQICFEVGEDLVAFNMRWGSLYQQNTLSEITGDFILDNRDRSTFHSLDTRSTVATNGLIFPYLGVILLTSADDAVVLVLLNHIELDGWVTPGEVLGDGDYAIFEALLDCVHDDHWVGGEDFDACETLDQLTTLNFGTIAFMDSDTDAIYVVDLGSQYVLLCIVALAVDSNNATFTNIAILDDNLGTTFSHTKDSSSLEINEPARAHDCVWVDEKAASCKTVLITHELTVHYVDSRVWERDKAWDFRSQVLW